MTWDPNTEDDMEIQKQHGKLTLKPDRIKELVQEGTVIVPSEVSQFKNNFMATKSF